MGEQGDSPPLPADVQLDFSDMRQFLMQPTPKDAGVIQCYIKRNKGGTNKMFPEYCLYMKEGDRFLLCSKKRPNNKTSNYLVSKQRGDLDRNSSNYLGKVGTLVLFKVNIWNERLRAKTRASASTRLYNI